MPMDEAVIDWQSLGTVQTASGQPRTRVVVVAVRREMVDRLVAASREAGLKLEGIDLSAFGMVRALAGGRKADGAVLYVSVGGLTNVAVANAQRLPVHARGRRRPRRDGRTRSPSAAA